MPDYDATLPLFAPTGVDAHGNTLLRRRTDGMRCVVLPETECQIGHDRGLADERPAHSVAVSSFIIDAEPVSILAYCHFLNCVDVRDEDVLRDWFIPANNDHRHEHVPIAWNYDRWQPRTARAASWPMMMVSWYGANAYSRWANRLDWRDYTQLHLFAPGQTTLPSETQWEYAARGPKYREYPWGNDEPTPRRAQFGLHNRRRNYAFDELPLNPVNVELGVSQFGLLHMAGNVWHWCADTYDPYFYANGRSRARNPLNNAALNLRSERGGSWIGSGALLRSSYRRGRAPHARGRCLGFRCTSSVAK